MPCFNRFDYLFISTVGIHISQNSQMVASITAQNNVSISNNTKSVYIYNVIYQGDILNEHNIPLPSRMAQTPAHHMLGPPFWQPIVFNLK